MCLFRFYKRKFVNLEPLQTHVIFGRSFVLLGYTNRAKFGRKKTIIMIALDTWSDIHNCRKE